MSGTAGRAPLGRRLAGALLAWGAGALSGCESHSTAEPPGAPVVHEALSAGNSPAAQHGVSAVLSPAFAAPEVLPALPVELGRLVIQTLDPFVDVEYRGLDVVNETTAWIGGSRGTVLLTRDRGENFVRCIVPNSARLDFRDIHAFDDREALVMSIGIGEDSRIYRTRDGGEHWSLVFKNPQARGFFDGMAFWNERRGIVYGDPVEGRFFLALTDDGGRSWQPLPADRLPEAREGEAGFAASGTGICVVGESLVWFCSGGAGSARVFRSEDGGHHWEAFDTPLEIRAASAGGFSLSFADELRGVLVGGDYLKAFARNDHCATTVDSGKTWQLVEADSPGGHRACVTHRVGVDGNQLIAVGRGGMDGSIDGGRSWQPMKSPGWYCVEFGSANFAFLTGPQGRLGRLIP